MIHGTFRDLYHRNSGQSLVEFALVLPILMLFILGIVDFGRIYSAHLTVENASRDGSRYASLGQPDTQVQAIVTQDTTGLQNVNVNISPDPYVSGDHVSVTVSATVPMVDPIFSVILGSEFTVTSTTSMRVE